MAFFNNHTLEKAQRWAVRVASSPRHGGGHVLRCLNLAKELKKQGVAVTFILDDEGHGAWGDVLAGAGFKTLLRTSLEDENWDGCIIDGYDFETPEIEDWRRKSKVVAMLIDHQDVVGDPDFIIKPAGTDDCASGLAHCVGLCGARYALVDPDFHAISPPEISETPRSVLVTFGLRDSLDATSRSIAALKRVLRETDMQFSITVVMGQSAPHLEKVKSEVRRSTGIELLVSPPSMPTVMEQADFVVGAGGGSLFERMAAGRPSLTIPQVDNQVGQARMCATTQSTVTTPALGMLSDQQLFDHLKETLSDQVLRARMSLNGKSTIDGLGAARAVSALLGREVDVHQPGGNVGKAK